jgi:hypothetical protein
MSEHPTVFNKTTQWAIKEDLMETNIRSDLDLVET